MSSDHEVTKLDCNNIKRKRSKTLEKQIPQKVEEKSFSKGSRIEHIEHLICLHEAKESNLFHLHEAKEPKNNCRPIKLFSKVDSKIKT